MKFRAFHRVQIWTLLTTLLLPLSGWATDVSQQPLIVASPDSVKANIFFVLDDSGSMGFDFLPDHVNGSGGSDPTLCRSGGATGTNSGIFSSVCCYGGNSSNACWTGAAPFGSLRGHPPFLAAGFNGMAYDPTITYKPPAKADGTYWPSQDRSFTNGWTSVKNDAYNIQNTGSIDLTTQYPDTEWCTTATNALGQYSYVDCLRNDNYVLPGTVGGKGYTVFRATVATGNGSVATGAPDAPTTTARSFGPHYYSIMAGEYCTDNTLRDCRGASGGGYTVPALVRWCKTDADARSPQPPVANCQATKNSNFNNVRYPTKYFSATVTEARATTSFTITANSSCPMQVTQVSVNGLNLLASATASNSVAAYIANAITAQINAKTSTTGYTAVQSSNKVTITAPSGVNPTAPLVFARTPTTCTLNLSNASPAFSGYVPPSPSNFPGGFKRVDIVPATTTYPKAATRGDCAAASTCSYDEEMTNFANWWTYYHTRMQMMKSAASLTFAAVGNNRRVGYMSINNNTGKDFLNIDTFEGTQKSVWFQKFTAAKPSNSTPLRTALSTAGKLYAGVLNGNTLNGTKVVDPIQYSCQKNFTILSTDGFWNESSTPTKPDGSAIGDQDGALPRPMYDGNKTANTLADVAAYYRLNDLRTGVTGSTACKSGSGSNADVCGNGDPVNEMQVMGTFTLGLGVSGYMQFSPSYLTDTVGDFRSVTAGTSANPGGGVCAWQTSGACNWPVPVNNTLTAVDDLWHAAVNGGGTYFSATSPASLQVGLDSALATLNQKIGAAASATTSNPNVSAGQNQVFVSNFKTGEWSGELKSQRIDINNGQVGTGADWSAQTQLDGNGSRTIYMFSAGASNKLKSFDWASMTSTEQANFQSPWIKTTGRSLTQFCTVGAYCLSAADQTKAAGQPLVNFLRGDRSNEGDLTTPTTYFRARGHVLGDVVNSEAVYVAQSLINLSDEGYGDFKTTLASRAGVVYVGANDGMLHAFSATTGDELWAYVPTAMLPKLYQLADKQYATQHQYFVDGTPVVQDVFIGGAWKTVLISGLGAGGRAYFALDVTNPASPKALWEFTDDNLGLTMGRADIGKLSDGSWVAVFGSGYNNTSPGDGKGRLYIVNVATGALIRTISTGVGTTGTPSGLAHVRGWVDNSVTDSTFQRVYGGDELGNLWRFDVNSGATTAQRIATLKSATGVAQPITSRPELGQVGSYAMVYVGTGRYLGQTDLTDASAQSIYGIKDKLDNTDIGDPRTPANKFVQQTLTTGGQCPTTGSAACSTGATVRTNGTPQAVNLAENGGWYVDLPQTRERVNTDPQLALGTLVVNSNVIESGNVCSVGGSSWANFFDYKTGAAVSTANGVVSVSLGNAVATRPALVELPNNKVISITRLSDDRTVSAPTPTPGAASNTRRISWRDLIQQ